LERTRRFAAGYAAHGVGKGSVVLVILEHHEDLMPAFLGATWLGAIPAFLPYPNPKTHPERFFESLKEMIETSRPRLILSRAPVCEVLERSAPGPGTTGDAAHRPLFLTVEDVTGSGLSAAPDPHGPADVAPVQDPSGST